MKMTLDHSLTYRTRSLRNIPHLLRLRRILSLLDSQFRVANLSYADFGCSNGYLTSLIAHRYSLADSWGYDCDPESISAATRNHPEVKFALADLNDPVPIGLFDVVTCFETLEHVGAPERALRKLLGSCKEGGLIIVTVPIETGALGLIKFLLKTIVYRRRYRKDLDEIFSGKWRIDYAWRVLFADNISAFRGNRARWGTHWGFDYRSIARFLDEAGVIYDSWGSATTRFFVIKNRRKTMHSKGEGKEVR